MSDMLDKPIAPIQSLVVVDDDIFMRLGSLVRHLSVGMMDEPVRMTVLSRSAEPVAEEAVGPSRLVHLPRRSWEWLRPRYSIEEVTESLGGQPPDVVHCLSADLARWMLPWVREWESELVVHLTDLVDARRFAGLRGNHGMTAIATTPGIEQVVVDRRPDLEGQVRVVPLGIPAEAEPACLAQPERVPAVVVTTPLTRDCGLHHVLKALEGVVKAGLEVHLFVLSAGPGEYLFRKVVQQLGLRSHVTFAGQLGDWVALREAIHGADFYILPGERRRFTISTLLAMATGLAILAPTGTIGDYLIDGQTASLFSPQNPRELGEKWATLLSDRATARQLAQGALDYIRTHHQASQMVSAVAETYRELCSVGRPASQTAAWVGE